MDASGLPIACNSCQHEFTASRSGKQTKAKSLDCKHNLCSECFSARIRILAKDQIMILKCPVSTCRHITTRPLPTGFCGSATKSVVRRGMGSNVKVRSKTGVEEMKMQTKKDILLEQFTDVPIPCSIPLSAPSVLHTDIEWLIYGIKVLYTVLILAVCASFALGFETIFSNPVAHLDNSFSSTALPILVAILLAAEFVPEEALLAHRESIRWAKMCDLLLILVLSAASCSTIHFGSAHALSQYLSMSLSSNFLILLVASVLVLKCTSVMHRGIVQLGRIATGLNTYIRYSNYITNILDRPKTTIPAITPIAEHVFITPKKHHTHSASTPTSTVRTMGLEYDSRYVCAPLLSIDYPEYSELTDYSELSEQSPLVHRKQIRNTLASSVDAVDTTSTTLSPTDDCTDALEANNTNITTTNSNTIHLINSAAADLSPTAQSETTQDIVAKVSMNMLADGYPWDEGVTLPSYSTNSNTMKASSSESTALGGNDTAADSVVPSTSTCVIYTDVEGLGLVSEDKIVTHIAFQPTTRIAAVASESIDTTPIEYEARRTQVKDNDLADEDVDHTEHTITSENDIDIAYALNCIYINPQEVELAMEKECTDVKEEECTLMSPSTYNPIHSTCTNNEQVLDVPSSNHSPVSSTADVHSLQYSDSSRSTPVTPTNYADSLSMTADPTHNDSDTTLVTPYTMSSALDTVSTVDVYKNPAPLFRVPKNPSSNQDLFVSPVETPVKGMEIGSGATTNQTATTAADGDNSNSGKLINSITSMYAHVPVYITPTKSIRSQWQHNTNTPKTMNMYQTYNSSVLHSPFYANTNSIATTPTVDSPDDEFRLRSNIKLKPLGRLSFGAASDTDSTASYNNSASARTSAYDNFVEHPISPEPHQTVSPRASTNKNNDTNTATASNVSPLTSSTSDKIVNSTHSLEVQKAASNSAITTKNNKNTINKEKKGYTQGLPRWKSILGPGNLIR